MAFLVGIDIGTSGTKTLLVTEAGEILAKAFLEYPLYQPRVGWAEQDPQDWWKAVCATVRNVLQKSNIDAGDIKGVGLSGQMHGAVLLDKDNNELRNAILWCDQRSYQECEQITSLIGGDRLINITANPALTAFTASKILWIRNNEPQTFERTRKILLPKDYIRFKLTGEFATEVSDASGMQLMDIPGRQWSDEVLGKLQIDKNMLGSLHESQQVSGTISRYASELTGLKEGTPVVGGAGDQAAGAVGSGIVRPGVVSSTIGTSGVVFASSTQMVLDPKGRVHTFCHAIPNTWHVMGVTQGAGLSLKWFRDNFCTEEQREAERLKTDPYILMTQEAQKAKPGCNGLIYLPYLMGERTPHLDPNAKGVFFGLSAKHEKQDMIRAVMEGVVFSLKDCLEIIEGMGMDIAEVRASGGGSRSELWNQMQADIFCTTMTLPNSDEGPALGAAILAGVGAGTYGSVIEACDAVVKVKETLHPDTAASRRYSKFHAIYKRLYKSLEQDFADLADII